jgi:hypothetical protein
MFRDENGDENSGHELEKSYFSKLDLSFSTKKIQQPYDESSTSFDIHIGFVNGHLFDCNHSSKDLLIPVFDNIYTLKGNNHPRPFLVISGLVLDYE